MSEIFFVIKTLVVTVLIVAVLQIKIGPQTIEQRSLSWMKNSNAIEALRGVADGAVAAIGNGYSWAKTAWKRQFPSVVSKGDAHDESTSQKLKEKYSEWEYELRKKTEAETD